MIFEINKVLSYEKEEFNNNFNDILTKMYNLYFKDESYDNYISNMMYKFKFYISQKSKYFKTISKEKVENILNIIALDELKKYNIDDRKMYNIISTFINNEISFKNNDENSMFNINKLIKFLTQLNYTPNEDFVIELLTECEELNLIIGKVLEQKKNYPRKRENVILNTFIDAYSMLNDIEIDNFIPDDESFDIHIDDEIEDDNVKVYLKEITRFKVLTPDEEKVVATRLKNGDLKQKKN